MVARFIAPHNEAPRQNAACVERVRREGRQRQPPERGMSARVGHEGAQRLQGKGESVRV